MNQPVKVKLSTRTVPASDETIAHRREIMQRMDELGQVDATSGEIGTTELQWIARIGDTELPLLDWDVQKLDDGKVAVSLVAATDELAVTRTTYVAQANTADREQRVIDALAFAERNPAVQS